MIFTRLNRNESLLNYDISIILQSYGLASIKILDFHNKTLGRPGR